MPEHNFASNSELTRFEYVAATIGYDLGITEITSSKTVLGEGYTLPVNVTVVNYGVYPETFNVTIYANSTLLTTQIITLANATSTTVIYAWNTTGFAKGNYTTSAVIDTLLGETYTLDNSITGQTITVTFPGDLNVDNVIDIFDLVKVALAFGSGPNNPNWDPIADINGDGIIDIFDITIIAIHFGETYP